MFDFIQKEKHEFLSKILGLGALLGVLWETVKSFAEGSAAPAGLFGFCSLFIFLWLLDAFKEAESVVIEAVETKEEEAFSSRRTLPVDLPSPPSSESTERLRSQLRELINQRFPQGRGAEINDYSYEPYVFQAEIRRSSLCACEVSARVRATKGNLIRSRVLTDEPQLYLGTLEVAIERTSGARKVVTVISVLLVALATVVHDAFPLVGIWLVVSAIVYVMAWDRTSRWFPDPVLATLRTDIESILVENGFIKPASEPKVARRRRANRFGVFRNLNDTGRRSSSVLRSW